MGLLELAIIFFVVAILAGALGFTGVASGFATIAKWLFGIFLVLAILFFILIALGITAF